MIEELLGKYAILARCNKNGIDKKEVQYLAEHKSPMFTVRVYLHYQAEELKKYTFIKIRKMSFA